MDLWALWGERLAALLLAFAAGWLVGQGRPSWRSDRFNEVDEYPQGNLMDLGDMSGLFGGCFSMFPGALGDLRNGCSVSSLVSLILICLALLCAANGWPPLWLNPLKAHPFEYVAVLFFQRWIWFTVAAFTAGCIAGGALALQRQDWFNR